MPADHLPATPQPQPETQPRAAPGQHRGPPASPPDDARPRDLPIRDWAAI